MGGSGRSHHPPLLQPRPCRRARHFIAGLVRRILYRSGRDRGRAQGQGIRAEVAGHLYWRTAVDGILRERAEGKTDALVLVGHSQGANNVIDMARMLEAKNVPVALLVTLAPYKQDPIPGNVMRAINFYQSTGWGAPITAGTGFRGRLSNIDVTEDSTVSHINIDKSTRVQAEIARDVEAIAKAN